MRITQTTIIIVFLFLLQNTCWGNHYDSEYVVLLHGLSRSKHSMSKLEESLSAKGFKVLNFGYPSRSKTIQELAEETIPKAIGFCREKGAEKIHFVTHSMGGILVRYYLKNHDTREIGRVVMLSPPNGGSEIVDKFRNNFVFKWINGPAGQELGTHHDSVPKKLGTVDFELGIITGDRTINLLFSLIIPGPDDGKVSVENSKVKGMKDLLVIHASHTFIMKNPKAIEQTISFIKHGKFTED